MKNNLCSSCNEFPVMNKKRQLCSGCYQKLRRTEGAFLSPFNKKGDITIKKTEHDCEILFTKNFFNHKNWQYSPTIFRLNGTSYKPDFYDGERNVFIEVSGTKQAYFANKHKYDKFRELYPKIKFEIRNTDGNIIDENKSINSQI